MEGNLGFWEILGRKFCEKKDKNEKFYFAKVEALHTTELTEAFQIV